MHGPPLDQRMRGRWRSALLGLGVEERFLVNRNGPCPMCGGTDRFRFDDKEGRGTWFCSQCGGPGQNGGAGNGIDLFMRMTDETDFHTTAIRLEAIFPDLAVDAPKPARKPEDEKRLLTALWRSGTRLDGSDAASRYLTRRVGFVPLTGEMRGAVDVFYKPDEDGMRPSKHPALLTRIWSPDGKPASVHRTYLTPDGRKAAVRSPKKVLGPIPDGSAARLMPPTDTIAIAEGIETSLAVTSLFGWPCWAGISAGNLEKWSPPDGVQHVIVCGDSDESFTGQAAAYALARRLVREAKRGGRELEVDVKVPDVGDWCDVLDQQRSAEKAA